MSTMAVDVTTIFHALLELHKYHEWKDLKWDTFSPEQVAAFTLFERFGPSVRRLKHLKAKASTEWTVLNKFLTDDGFDEMFDGPLDGVGAVSIIDMLIEWLRTAELCKIQVFSPRLTEYPGFAISPSGYRLHDLGQGYPILVELLTKTGENLWAMQATSAPRGHLDMIQTAFTTMSMQRRPSQRKTSTVELPEVSFDIKPDISWLKGALKTNTRWYISDAMQQFKFKMNRFGARMKVATGIVTRCLGVQAGPLPLVFDKPFYLWATQPGVPNLPIGIIYADTDTWKAAGDLNDM